MGFQQRRTECGEGLQGVLQRHLGIFCTGVTSGLGLPPGLTNDPVMRLHNRVSKGTAPFHYADG